ncbi:MAG: serine/threonine protein kinase, partial [Planctomycetes bacterium]|nr:serine/threonine protein kinase [Planctomycetota bacterium]
MSPDPFDADIPTAAFVPSDPPETVAHRAAGPGAVALRPPERPDEIGRLGHYRVLGAIGYGGMGLVYRAEDPHLRRAVALKVLLPRWSGDPLARMRFLREAQAQARVEHEHVVPIYQVGEENGVPFFAMPLLRGETLAAALERDPRPGLPEVLRIGREIADGLAAAHGAGLVHRDIKPANVWLEGAGRKVKVLDFGLARGGADPLDHHTATGAIIGTPAYMSPEQARGEPVDHRTDLFSLGAVLYQMATGRQPFTGTSTLAVLTAVTTHAPPPVRELVASVPARAADLIHSLLEKDAADRPDSAAEVAEALRRLELRSATDDTVAAGPRRGR